MKNPFDTPDEVDEKVVKAAVPMIGGIALAAVGVGILNICCTARAKKISAFGILPVGMAAATAAVAAWAYLNPEAIPTPELDDMPESIRKRLS